MFSMCCGVPNLSQMPASRNLLAFADDAVRFSPVDVNCKEHWETESTRILATRMCTYHWVWCVFNGAIVTGEMDE